MVTAESLSNPHRFLPACGLTLRILAQTLMLLSCGVLGEASCVRLTHKMLTKIPSSPTPY